MPLKIVASDRPLLETILGLIKKTHSPNHDILKRFCAKRGGTVADFLALRIQGGQTIGQKITELVSVIEPGEPRDQVSLLKKVGFMAPEQEIQ
jgi:hypothetical protein